jgi:hypothetical protein
MRLLNTETLELKQFFGNPKHPYTILSHTWGDAEVTLQEFRSSNNPIHQGRTSHGTAIEAKAGYGKILDCCKRSLDDGYRWTWVDTCCIDKTNSVELSEAINSMFQWYQNAAVCYVFLDDVTKPPDPQEIPRDPIHRSRWFTRGWTLQELIAPPRVFIFDTAWQLIGELTEGSGLLDVVSETTGIPGKYLHNGGIHSASISMRMSWAAKRQTTREEDMAYCLLGIFNVNMPLLYGEGGEKAFIRLQEEIIKTNFDQTIFAWVQENTSSLSSQDSENIGIFAKSASAFQYSGNIVPSMDHIAQRVPFQMTNLGLRMSLPFWQGDKDGEFLGLLDCHEAEEPGKRLALPFISWNNEEHSFESVGLYLWKLLKKLPIGLFKDDRERVNVSAASEFYRSCELSPIRDGSTMYRRDGPLLFKEIVPSSTRYWHELITDLIKAVLIAGGPPPNSTPSDVFISQPRTSRLPSKREIVIIVPRNFTWTILRPSDSDQEVQNDDTGRIFLPMNTREGVEGVSWEDIHVRLWHDSATPGSHAALESRSRGLCVSLHWEQRSRPKLSFLSPGTLDMVGTLTQQDLRNRFKLGSKKLRQWGMQYSSLISNYGPYSLRVEIKEEPTYPETFRWLWGIQGILLSILCMGLIFLPWMLFLRLINGGPEILLGCSMSFLLSVLLSTPRNDTSTAGAIGAALGLIITSLVSIII